MRNFIAIFSIFAAISPSIATAGAGGIWIGDASKDPITDKAYSLAMLYANDGEANVALRCKDEAPDIFIKADADVFAPGSRQQVTIRFDTAAPVPLDAIATQPNLLVVMTHRDAALFLPFLHAEKIAIRFEGEYHSQITLLFGPFLRPNALAMVGRVLADCKIAPFPEEELAKASAALDQEAKRSRKPSR